MDFKLILIVGVGSSIGAFLRYTIDYISILIFGINNFIVISVINIIGSFLFGFVSKKNFYQFNKSISYRKKFWGIGFCGGFTTFSSYIEIIANNIFLEKNYIIIINVLIIIILSITFYFIGFNINKIKSNFKDSRFGYYLQK